MDIENRSVLTLIRRKGFRQFLSLCVKYRRLYVTVLLLQLGGTAVSLLLAETTRRLFNGGSGLSKPELSQLIAAVAGFVLLGLVISLMSRIFNQVVNTNVVFQMRQMVLTRLMEISLQYHENRHSSQAKNLLFGELEVFKQFIVFDVLRLISLPFSFIAVGVYLMTVHPLLGLIVVCVGPLQLVSNLVIKGSFKDLAAKEQANGSDVFFHMGETLAGIREVKMNQLEQSVAKRFQQVCKEGIRLWVSIEKVEAVRELIRLLPEKLGYVLGLAVGAVLLVNGDIGAGALFAFITLLDKSSESFGSIVGIII
jgi:ABC-type bacteriocin/lantibiotic exporter with double-glycine peptidase domain